MDWNKLLGDTRQIAANAFNAGKNTFNAVSDYIAPRQEQPKVYPNYKPVPKNYDNFSNQQIFIPQNKVDLSAQQGLLRQKNVQSAFKPFVYGEMKNFKPYEGTIDRRYQQFIQQNYPMTDQMKKIMDNKVAFNFTNEKNKPFGGQYIGSETFNPVTRQSMNPGVGNIVIPANQYNFYPAETGMHELIHARNEQTGANKNMGLANQFNSQWNNQARNDINLQNINKIMGANKELYGGINNRPLNQLDERLAYLGGLGGDKGLNNLPPEFIKYFLDVFKK